MGTESPSVALGWSIAFPYHKKENKTAPAESLLLRKTRYFATLSMTESFFVILADFRESEVEQSKLINRMFSTKWHYVILRSKDRRICTIFCHPELVSGSLLLTNLAKNFLFLLILLTIIGWVLVQQYKTPAPEKSTLNQPKTISILRVGHIEKPKVNL